MEEIDRFNDNELIVKSHKGIGDVVNEPLISNTISITTLNYDYPDDPAYIKKVEDISSKYKNIRKVKTDGNSFYRAFGFALLEHLVKDKNEFMKFRQIIKQSKAKLIKLNFPQSALDDFYNAIMEIISKVEPSDDKDVNEIVHELYCLFNEQTNSDYFVIYLRIITSGKIQGEAEYYSKFMKGNTNLLDYCKNEVEPMYKESENIHIIAICSALGFNVRVVYMDSGNESEVITRDFPESEETKPSVYLLCRNNYYDILYQ